jgi:hypothetical protein
MQRIREKSGTSMTADSTPTPAAPTNTPINAVTIGRPIATTEPNAISNTRMATPMPMSSLAGASCFACASSPVKFVSTPAARVTDAAAVASSSCVVVNLSTA